MSVYDMHLVNTFRIYYYYYYYYHYL